jgi:hypothetical protein
MNEQEVIERLGLGNLPEEVRSRWTPISPFCIVREVRKGVAGFRVSDMRSNRSVRVPTKRDATKVAKMIEADFYRKASK